MNTSINADFSVEGAIIMDNTIEAELLSEINIDTSIKVPISIPITSEE